MAVDSVLSHKLSEMVKGKPDEITIHADLPGYQINCGSIPADILTTLQRPDIVIVSRSKKQISLFELSISLEKNKISANLRKLNRYQDLALNLTNKGWLTYSTPFEIGSRGLINKINEASLSDTMRTFKSYLNTFAKYP